MKNILLFVGILLCIASFAQEEAHQVKVQVYHNQSLVVDTALYDQDGEVKEAIESIVNKYSNEAFEVSTASKLDLYVFNISDEQWNGKHTPIITFEEGQGKSERIAENKAPKKPKAPKETSKGDDLGQLEADLQEDWENEPNQHSIHPVIDTLAAVVKEVGNEVLNVEINEEVIDSFVNDINEFFMKVKSSKVIVVHEKDTVFVK
jgi:hypothetical protein